MRELKESLTTILGALVGDDLVNYIEPEQNEVYPQVNYWFINGQEDGEQAAFLSEDVEYIVAIQSVSRTDAQADELREKVRDRLKYGRIEVAGWRQVGRIRWDGILPDPGDRLEDNSIVYYGGDTYRISLSRTRSIA